MLNMKKQLKPIIATIIVTILAISVYIFLKITTSTQIVSGDAFNKIINKYTPQELYIKDNYIVALTENGEYKVAKDAINKNRLLAKYPIKIYSKSSTALISVAILILLSILAVLIVILKKNTANKSLNFLPQSSSSDSDNLTSDIKPQFNPQFRFKNIAGISDVKDDLEDIINFLKDPTKYQKKDIRMPKGLLLVGPPGVGKTLIAKAISAEAGVPFFYNSGANFVHIYAGAGAKRVKELFKKAKELEPSIIFIDEIDAVGKSRDTLDSNEREATLNQLLVEMDGFNPNEGVVVIGATNRLEILDSALLRSGRFDRRVFIGLPNIDEREQIIKLYLEEKKHNLDVKEVAKITAGFSPASIETLINEAALKSFKSNKESIDIEDIYAVKDQVMYGKKRVKILTQKEREIQADYVAAKSVIATWLGFDFEKANLLIPININEDINIVSKSYLINKAKVYLSGTLYLEQKYNDSFNISNKDRAQFNKILNEISSNYTFNSNFDIGKLENELKETLNRLEAAIKESANILKEKEIISKQDIKKYIDQIF